MQRRPPRSTRLDTPFPPRRSSDLAVIAPVAPAIDAVVMAQAARLVGPPVAVVAIGIPGFPRVLGALAVGGRPGGRIGKRGRCDRCGDQGRSEEHTSELQSLMSITYAVFCLKKKNISHTYT